MEKMNVADEATAYAVAVQSGEIVAGPYVRAACKRHLDDLERGAGRGLHWDVEAAARILRFCRTVLRLSEGQFDGKPFDPEPPQAFILGSLFGWKRDDGTRRFRRAYIEMGKGSGKSPMAGGIGLYGLVADDEAGAQIYSAGATKEQAGILFRDAVSMVGRSPALSKVITPSGGPGREFNLAYLKTQSFFRPVSRETKKTGSGPRPHFALCDELHEHPDGGVIEILERGFKFRRQPLLVLITNSGTDRQSVCWEERKHAVSVAERVVDDDTTFSYVCALDQARTETYSFDIALRHAIESCSCNAQIILTDLPSPQDFAALVIQRSGEQITSPKASGVSITPSVRLLLDAFVTLATSEVGSGAVLRQLNAGKNIKVIGLNRQTASQKLESGTENTEKGKSKQTLRGKSTAQDWQSTESRLSSSRKPVIGKVEDAEFAVAKLNVSGWITATLQELCEDCSAIPAMQELVCSEIISKLYDAHSNTCKVRQRFRLQSGRLSEDLPADDPLTDENCWIKANPLLDVTISREYLRGVAKQARDLPGKRNGILRLHFCVWTDADTAWIEKELWDQVVDKTLDLADYLGKPCHLGLDLSVTRDMTARAMVFEDGEDAEGRPLYVGFIKGYLPKASLDALAQKDGQHWERFADDPEHLEIFDGKTVRLDEVARELVDIAERFKVETVAYDSWLFQNFKQQLDDLGLSLPIVEHPQGWNRRKDSNLSMPSSIDAFEKLILERRIRLQFNPILNYAASSAAFVESPAGLRRFAKEKAGKSKIDALVAMTMAVGSAIGGETKQPEYQMFFLGDEAAA